MSRSKTADLEDVINPDPDHMDHDLLEDVHIMDPKHVVIDNYEGTFGDDLRRNYVCDRIRSVGYRITNRRDRDGQYILTIKRDQ